MASEVEICNLALGHLGDEANISAITPPDGSAQADYCHQFYPIARDEVLSRHPWSFATRRVALALLSTTELPAEWAYAYSRPNCIEVLGVYPPGTTTTTTGLIFDEQEFASRQPNYPFVQETLSDGTQVIFTNVEYATAKYIARVTNTGVFQPLVVTAIARLLASHLAGPVIKGERGAKIAAEHRKLFETVDLPLATSRDSGAQRDTSYDKFIPSSLAVR